VRRTIDEPIWDRKTVIQRIKSVLFVLGTRPEAIKLCPLIRVFRERLPKTRVWVCSTGQHKEMLDQSLRFFGISPDIELNVMEPGQTLFGLTAKVISGMERVCSMAQPDYVVVQGDTTTAMAGAIVHVEAGLRTGNLSQPFPEEANRSIVSRLAVLHFAPTESARKNLAAEGIHEGVYVVGNTVIDALIWAAERASLGAELGERLSRMLGNDRRLILVTGHRRESFGEPFHEICRAIRGLADREDTGIVYPVHLNPRVREPVMRILGDHKRILLTDPVDYPVMVALMKAAYIILTDSGGIQEEGPSLGKPVLVMRRITERPESIEAGTCRIVGTDSRVIKREASLLLDDPSEYSKMSGIKNPYGDGHASEKIVEILSGRDGELI
jgi:UDP-N-acetylglucosamine 2-epimerase (non-hydrolysing)